MAVNSGKRSRPPPTNSQRSKKRQKLEALQAETADTVKVPVAHNALPWNGIEMPEMYDDAEGFFGLEEVDDVEVIREGDKVSFISSKSTRVGTEDAEEEFKGFEDDNPANLLPASLVDKSNREGKGQKKEQRANGSKKSKDTPTGLKAGAVEDDLNSAVNGFVTLAEHADGDETDVSLWAEIELSSETMSALSRLGFSHPTPIQLATIPKILAGHDVIGKASTGSGKTLAFGIPILESWLRTRRDLERSEDDVDEPYAPVALILSPTRELAHQLKEHIAALCSGLTKAPRIATVTGGLSVHKQQRQLFKADIVIGTPGRLWEVLSSSASLTEAFKDISILVVDEADRLLNDGHFKEATQILESMDRKVDTEEGIAPARQTLVFSATFHKGLQQKLAGKGKHGLMDESQSMEYLLKKLNFREDNPKFVDVNPVSQMAAGLKEGMLECAGSEKDLYLYSLLLHHPSQRTLIFTNSIHSVRRLVPLLQNLALPALALHSQMPQKARLRSLERFSSPTAPASILVATDVAARGLDIRAVSLIIHYHLPRTADMYVHRSGRTARASLSGSSILLCAPDEVVGVRRLVAKVHAHNAATAGQAAKKSKYYMRTLDLDRRVVARLRPRVTLAKQIADSALAKEKLRKDDEWMRNAAEELGVEYDSEEFELQGKGRGTERKRKEKEAKGMTKGEVGALKAELREVLSKRVNVGTSERYLTGGTIDIDALLKGQKGEFLGSVEGIGMDDDADEDNHSE